MKETVKVNLGGRLFNLDNDAYEKLKAYLYALRRKFSMASGEADEIIEDIESRIAELLKVKISVHKEVITLDDIEEIIAQLGTPEEMVDEEAGEEPNEQKKEARTETGSKTRKRFYRDIDHSILGGVGSGLGAYFNIDPIWIRLIFVGLFFANLAGLLIYIILWVVIPPARTTAQKLEMQGKPVNIDNIGESVKGEFEKVKGSFKNMANSNGMRKVEHSLSEFFNILGNILLMVIKVVGAIVGVSLIVALVVVLISLFAGGAIIFPHHWFHGWQFHHMSALSHLTLTGICLFLVIALPVFALLVKIIKWLFGIKTRNGFAAGIGATILVLAFIALIVMLVVDTDKGTYRDSYHTDYTFETGADKLYLDIDLKDNASHRLEYYQFFNFEFVWDEWNDHYLQRPKIEIQRWDKDYIKLDVYKTFYKINLGKHKSWQDEIIQYNWNFSGSKLELDEYFSVDEDYVWQWPKLELVVTVPENLELIYSATAKDMFGTNEKSRHRKIMEKHDTDKEPTEDKVEILKELEGVEK